MYYLKIWRETRILFFALLILAFCVGSSAWSQVILVIVADGYEVGHVLPETLASRVWAQGMQQVMTFGAAALYFIGLMVGSSGLGEEIERGTAVFLLTRPRSRGYFLWSFWLASGLELLAFASMTMLTGYATLFYMTRRAGPWSFLLLGPMFMITGLLAVGLANLLAIGSRRSKNVVGGGIAFTVLYLVACFVTWALRQRYIVHAVVLPSPLNMYSLDWNAALAGTMLGWLAVSVAFVALAHLMVTRMEV